jgi:hypothetical protein
LSLTVAKVATTMVIGGTEASTYGQTAVFNGSIGHGSTALPAIGLTGVVSFYDGTVGPSTLLGSATPVFGAGAETGDYTGVFSISTLSAGTHNIVASYAGDTNYATSTSTSAPIVVAKASQTITFTGLPSTASVGATFTLNGTASSGLAVTYTVSGQASLAGTLLTITGSGPVSVTALQAGDANHNAATPVTQTIIVGKSNQTITFTGLPASLVAGSPSSYTLNGTASSGLAVTYTVSGPATLSGNKLTINATSAATVSVTASQIGNANYNAATPVTQTIVLGTVQLTTSAVLSEVSGGYQAVVTVVNSGSATAQSVELTAAALGAANGTVLPASFGSIAGGGSASVTLTFPSSAGAKGAPVVEKLTGTYTGGTFGGSFRATLP